jgi:excisionase family DNA binding protein
MTAPSLVLISMEIHKMTLIDNLRRRKTYLSTPETMALISVSRNTLCRWVRAGLISAIRAGGSKYLFDPNAIADWLETRATAPLKKAA